MKIKDFKEGDTVKITGYPNKWNSAFGGNDPSKISYPVIGKIDKMGASKYTTKWALNVNGYGFSLQDLIDQDMIELIEETPEYEVGDWIYWERPSKDFKGNEAWNVGSVGLVTSIESRMVSCKPFYTPSGEKWGSGATYISNIRKALPHEIPTKERNLQVGDTFKNSKGSTLLIEAIYCNDVHVSSKNWTNSQGTSMGMHLSMQWGIFQDWVDSMKCEMWVEKSEDGLRFWYNIFGTDGSVHYNEGYSTRQEARNAAIEKLNDLINEQ